MDKIFKVGGLHYPRMDFEGYKKGNIKKKKNGLIILNEMKEIR